VKDFVTLFLMALEREKNGENFGGSKMLKIRGRRDSCKNKDNFLETVKINSLRILRLK